MSEDLKEEIIRLETYCSDLEYKLKVASEAAAILARKLVAARQALEEDER